MDYSPHFSAQNLIEPNSTNKDAIRKSISRGVEWRKFQLHRTFQSGVMSVERWEWVKDVTAISANVCELL